MAAGTECEHIYGGHEADDYYDHVRLESDKRYCDVRFAFCPTCGTPIDWATFDAERDEAERTRLLAIERREQEDAEKKRLAAEARLLAQRMRGADWFA